MFSVTVTHSQRTMASKSEAKKWCQEIHVGKKKKESKNFLGGLTPHDIIDQEDFEIQPVLWRDPFRMSVLDFQRNALDKLAEVLKILIKYATEKDSLQGKPLQREGFKTQVKEPMEDLHFQLHHIKFRKEVYENLLKTPTQAINTKCDMLLMARNLTAHQAYIKYDNTPPDNPSKPSKNILGTGHVPLKKTRTFTHTKDVVITCIEFAEKVLEGMKVAGEPDKSREVEARVANLQLLKQEFMEFIDYRDLERHNLEVFFGERMRDEEQRKAAAMEVLDMLREKVEKGEDDVTNLLTCVVAPRCCIKLKTE